MYDYGRKSIVYTYVYLEAANEDTTRNYAAEYINCNTYKTYKMQYLSGKAVRGANNMVGSIKYESLSKALLSYSDSYLKDNKSVQENMAEMQKHSDSKLAAEVTISEEGKKALQHRGAGLVSEYEDIDISKMKLKTNEVAWEHYTAMREFSHLTLKDGNYNVEDVMKSIMEAYEVRYQEMMKEHKNGDRQVAYELTGERELTLEEDLAGLDEAFKMRLANLEGYITCQQVNKAFANPDCAWYFQKLGIPYNGQNKEVYQNEDYNYMDEEYRNTAISIMKQAREQFLTLFLNTGYRKGTAIQVVSKLMYADSDFMEKTQKLV